MQQAPASSRSLPPLDNCGQDNRSDKAAAMGAVQIIIGWKLIQ
jgi:hypothetical protein